jgi:S-formylglutathione hydrolase
MSPPGLELVFERNRNGGVQKVFKHGSKVNNCEMKFSIFVPNKNSYEEKFHVLFFLAGAECNEQHFLNRTEFHDHASEFRFIVVCPDTSPRKINNIH